MSKIKLVIIVVVSVLMLIIVLQNRESVETRLLFMRITMPLAALLFVTGVLGFALGVLLTGKLIRRGDKPDR